MAIYPVGLWRVPSPIIKNGKYDSLIVDAGELKKAIANSDNNFLFAESVNGVVTEATKPLAFIGTFAELTSYLIENKSKKILNRVKGLNSIYIGMSQYKPKARFTGVFPLQDFGVKFFSQIVGIFPDLAGLKVPAFVDAAGVPGTLDELVSAIVKLKTADDRSSNPNNLFFLKVSYLPEDGMIEYKSNEISFAGLLNLLKVGGTQIM
jgi:hypothetical protein